MPRPDIDFEGFILLIEIGKVGVYIGVKHG
jgi:hypothetical protein